MHPSNYRPERHRELLAESRRDAQAAQLRALRRASRRVDRAARRLERAQAVAQRRHSEVGQQVS
jgi:hypothetical protein